jgi:hypothetical protein
VKASRSTHRDVDHRRSLRAGDLTFQASGHNSCYGGETYLPEELMLSFSSSSSFLLGEGVDHLAEL